MKLKGKGHSVKKQTEKQGGMEGKRNDSLARRAAQGPTKGNYVKQYFTFIQSKKTQSGPRVEIFCGCKKLVEARSGHPLS
jgi:hypothetical protein